MWSPVERVRSFLSWWMVALWVTITLSAFFAIRPKVGGFPVGLALWAGFIYTAAIVFAVEATKIAYRLFKRAVFGPEEEFEKESELE